MTSYMYSVPNRYPVCWNQSKFSLVLGEWCFTSLSLLGRMLVIRSFWQTEMLTKAFLSNQANRSSKPCPHFAGGIWKRHFHSENASNVFRPRYAGEICATTNATIISHCGFIFEENSVRKWLSSTTVVISSFSKCFSPALKREVGVFNFLHVKSVFVKKLRLRDGLH